MSVEWTTPQMKGALKEELKSWTDLRDGRIVKSEEGREIVARSIRLLEVLIDGEATTVLPARHHE